MVPPKKSKALRALETACGGAHVDNVPLNDGRRQRVFVRKLPLRLCDRYVALCMDGKEQERLELCLGESPDWSPKYNDAHPADRFTPEAQLLLVQTADDLNFPTALSQIERRKNTIGGLEPFLKRLYATQALMMEDAFKKMVDSATSSLTRLVSLAEATLKSGATGASTSSPLPSNAPTSEPTPPPASPPSATSTPPTTPSAPRGASAAPTTPCAASATSSSPGSAGLPPRPTP